jgi:hypothetical protein
MKAYTIIRTKSVRQPRDERAELKRADIARKQARRVARELKRGEYAQQ